jgi:hypothetical protein
MKSKTTFTDRGWDFIGETANGTDDIWTIDEGKDYPRFVAEVVRGFAGDEVEFADFCLLADYWLHTNCANLDNCAGVDVDFSGAADFADLRALAQHWLSGL